ncbi:hypothetical protein GCM10027456_25110 [Kineosporia babensis]
MASADTGEAVKLRRRAVPTRLWSEASIKVGAHRDWHRVQQLVDPEDALPIAENPDVYWCAQTKRVECSDCGAFDTCCAMQIHRTAR